MQKKLTYILDIGSSSLRLYAITKIGKVSHILTEEQALYDGYLDGEFLSTESFNENVGKIVGNMELKLKATISKIYVGVPADFCVTICKRISRKFTQLHKIKHSDLIDLYESNMDFGENKEFSVVNFSPMQFILDDDFSDFNVEGKNAYSITVDCSYILAKTSFLDFVSSCLNKLNISDVEFLSTPLGQAMVCRKNENLTRPFVVVDCGHISTSVAVLKGEGLALLSSFSMGGGFVSSDLMKLLNLKFSDAELLKRKVLLTIETNKNDNYEISSSSGYVCSPINATNQIVKSRVEKIVEVINNILSIDNVFDGLDIFITGDGLANFKGVKNIVEELTSRKVHLYKIPNNHSYDKFQTSKIGLMYLTDIVV